MRRMMNRVGDLAPNGRRGMATLNELLAERYPNKVPLESDLERDFLKLVIKRFRLPTPVHQHPVRVGPGTFYRIDFAYPELMIGIEVDGYAYHLDPPTFQHDRTRASGLASRGWLMLFFTSDDVTEQSAETAALVRDTIDGRSRGLLRGGF